MKKIAMAIALLILVVAGLFVLIRGGHHPCQSGLEVKLGGVIDTGGC